MRSETIWSLPPYPHGIIACINLEFPGPEYQRNMAKAITGSSEGPTPLLLQYCNMKFQFHFGICGASIKAPPAADYCMALTVGWRRAILAKDKVVRPINLAVESSL